MNDTALNLAVVAMILCSTVLGILSAHQKFTGWRYVVHHILSWTVLLVSVPLLVIFSAMLLGAI